MKNSGAARRGHLGKFKDDGKNEFEVSNSEPKKVEVDFGIADRILYSVIVYYALQAVVLIITNWAIWDFKTKLFSLECLNYALFLLLLTTEHSGLFGNRAILNALIRPDSDEKGTIGDSNSNRKQKMMDEMNKEGLSFLIMAGHSTKCLYFSYSFNSIEGLLKYISGIDQDTAQLPKPCIIEIPFSIVSTPDSIFHYVFISFLHCIYLYVCYDITANIYVFCVTGYTTVAVELKMFQVRLKELDETFEGNKQFLADSSRKNVVESDLKNFIKSRVKELVMDHQRIFRKMNQLSKGNSYMIFYVNAFVCIQICLAIISFQNGTVSDKMKYCFRATSIVAFCYVYSEYGQGIQEEFENVRNTLYSFCGAGKPVWIQKTFLILMIRNTNIPQLSFCNTFTNERRNLANVIRAAYSYFNLLNQRNKLVNNN